MASVVNCCEKAMSYSTITNKICLLTIIRRLRLCKSSVNVRYREVYLICDKSSEAALWECKTSIFDPRSLDEDSDIHRVRIERNRSSQSKISGIKSPKIWDAAGLFRALKTIVVDLYVDHACLMFQGKNNV